MVCCTKLTVLVAERLLPPQLLLRCSNSVFCTHYSPAAQSNIESLKCNTAAPNAEPVAICQIQISILPYNPAHRNADNARAHTNH